MRKGKIIYKIEPETILSIKKEVVDKLVREYNAKHSYKDSTGNLRNSVGWHEKDGRIYIMIGIDNVIII